MLIVLTNLILIDVLTTDAAVTTAVRVRPSRDSVRLAFDDRTGVKVARRSIHSCVAMVASA